MYVLLALYQIAENLTTRLSLPLKPTGQPYLCARSVRLIPFMQFRAQMRQLLFGYRSNQLFSFFFLRQIPSLQLRLAENL